MWRRNKETETETLEERQDPRTVGTGSDFEAAADRVAAQAVPAPGDPLDEVVRADADNERLEIRPEWAQGVARLCFLPAARLSHPAYALTDEEADKIAPQIGALMQAVADKYAPALVGRVANKHPELFDAIAAIGVLYWQKWRLVSRLMREEEKARLRMRAENQQPKEREEAEAFARTAVASVTLPEEPKLQPGDRAADGSLVI